MPLLPAFACLAAGICAASVGVEYDLYIAAFLAAICVSGLLLRRVLLSLFSAVFAIGVLAWMVHSPETVQTGEGSVRYMAVASDVSRGDFSQRAVVRILSPAGSRGGVMLLRVHSSMPVVNAGDTVVFVADAEPVESGHSIPGEYSTARYAMRVGVTAMADVVPLSSTFNSGNFTVIPPSRITAGEWLRRQRERLSDAIYASGVSGETADLMNAILTGDSSYIDSGVRERFSMAGIAHVLALSGMHVSVIAMIMSVMFFPLRIVGRRWWELSLTILLLWGYALLTGMSASVTRAVIMATVVIAARLMRRNSSPLNSLCLAGIVILLFRPRELFAPGFQLSFIAAASILMFAFELTPGWRMPSLVRVLWQWIAVSVSAVAGTGVLAAWHFHMFPLCFLLANIPAMLALPVLMGGELLLLALNAAGLSPEWLTCGLDWLYGCLVWVSDAVSGIGGGAVRGIYFPGWLMVPYYLGLLAVWLALKWRNLAWGISGFMLIAAGAAGYALTRPEVAAWEAYEVDYPYATVILVREGAECRLLTDAPPTQYGNIAEFMKRKLAGYADLRGVDIGKVNVGIHGRHVYAADNLWCFGGMAVATVGKHDGLKAVAVRPRYALVSARYFGKMSEVCEVLSPDTVAIAESVPPERLARYMAELDSIGYPRRVGLPPVLK